MVRTKLWGRDTQNMHPEEENDRPGRADGSLGGLKGHGVWIWFSEAGHALFMVTEEIKREKL